jgi:hypothetical protein
MAKLHSSPVAQLVGRAGPPHNRGFTITLRHATIGRTLLDEWSSRWRHLYLTTHNTHKRQTYMAPAGFEAAIPTSGRLQTHALDRAATGIGNSCIPCTKLKYNTLRYSVKWYNPYRTLVSNSEHFTLTDAARCIVEYQYDNSPVSISTKVSFFCRCFNVIMAFRGKRLTSQLVYRFLWCDAGYVADIYSRFGGTNLLHLTLAPWKCRQHFPL